MARRTVKEQEWNDVLNGTSTQLTASDGNTFNIITKLRGRKVLAKNDKGFEYVIIQTSDDWLSAVQLNFDTFSYDANTKKCSYQMYRIAIGIEYEQE